VFSSNLPPRASPKKINVQFGDAPKFTVLQEERTLQIEKSQPVAQPSKSQTDSGYHGSSQNTIEVEVPSRVSPVQSPARSVVRDEAAKIVQEADVSEAIDGLGTTEGSFHSAEEEHIARLAADASQTDDIAAEARTQTSPRPAEESHDNEAQKRAELYPDLEEIGSPSDESTPDRPLVRKSSLTFASLPAREPMKTSIGTRISRTSHLDQTRVQAVARKSHVQRLTAAALVPQAATDDQDEVTEMEDDEDDEENVEILGRDESDMDIETTKAHSKSTTQRLHDKIEMLGKAPPPRPSKSIPSAVALANMRHSGVQGRTEIIMQPDGGPIEDDDDWIKPLKSPEAEKQKQLAPMHDAEKEDVLQDESEDEDEFDVRAPELIAHEERMRTPAHMGPSPTKVRPGFGHSKSASTATLASPAKIAAGPPPSPAKSISVSNPAMPTTTPQGSPRKFLDISASKSKFQSMVKTAKGLFTSSAGVSVAAKMETLSPKALHMAANTMPGMYPSLDRMLEDKPLPASPPKQSRRTRSSTEREKEAKAMQKMDGQLERAREKEAQKAAQQKQAQQMQSSPRKPVEDQSAFDMPPPAHQGTSKTARPVRPTRDASTRARPQPVSIRVGALPQRMPVSSASLAQNSQDTFPAELKRPGLTKKASTASLQSSTSTNNFKTSVTAQAAKPRALLAAERKKEQDEREALRKLEQKRELERKRAAAQEEARKQEQKQRAEVERKERERVAAEQAKRQAQQQAIEKKRQENVRKAEQQRIERAATEAVSSSVKPSIATTDLFQSVPRPVSRLGGQAANRPLINHPLPTNAAKPAKRALEEDNAASRPQATKYGAASQQTDAKRRRTDEETIIEPHPRPTMSGAPIRQSQLGKKPSIFNHPAYAAAPQPVHFPQPPPRAHPTQYGIGAKIPFADAPNPPMHAKTPASAHQHKTIPSVKSSPQIQNGDNIHLPDIPSDSEDEDSDDDGNAFPIPDWATPGHLTDQLIRQEGMDGDAVFGPIAPLKMEEIFAKGNKERLKRLRDRTSSANWALSGDGLTLEEVKSDREQRERMRIQGGWVYGNGS